MADQAVFRQRREQVENFGFQFRIAGAHGLRRIQSPAAGKHGEPPEQALSGGVEQVVTPGDGLPQTAMPLGALRCASAKQVQPLRQPRQQCAGREKLDARRGQFDRQRQTVQTGA